MSITIFSYNIILINYSNKCNNIYISIHIQTSVIIQYHLLLILRYTYNYTSTCIIIEIVWSYNYMSNSVHLYLSILTSIFIVNNLYLNITLSILIPIKWLGAISLKLI